MNNTANYAQIQVYESQKDKFDAAQEKVRQINVDFSKDTLLQLVGQTLYWDAIDLQMAFMDKDYSRLLLMKCEELFADYEVLKQNPRITQQAVTISRAIQTLQHFRSAETRVSYPSRYQKSGYAPKGRVTEESNQVNFNIKWKI